MTVSSQYCRISEKSGKVGSLLPFHIKDKLFPTNNYVVFAQFSLEFELLSVNFVETP